MCLYWVGEFRGRDFHVGDIERLFQSVRKHIDRSFKFYCLTNTEEDLPDYVNVIPLIYNWPGWWSKMELHRPDLPAGRTLYMDLDSHAVNSLQPVLDYPGDLVMFDTRIPNHKKARLEARKWVVRYQAATMLFTPGVECMRQVWERFTEDPNKWMSRYRSDQDVMGDWIPNQPTFPKQWMVKLATLRGMKLPEEVIIVTGQTADGLFRRTETIEGFEQRARG